MKRTELGKLLRDIADAVESGDSMEGTVQWEPGAVRGEVHASVRMRTGKLDGKLGGYLLIGAPPEPTYQSDDESEIRL